MSNVENRTARQMFSRLSELERRNRGVDNTHNRHSCTTSMSDIQTRSWRRNWNRRMRELTITYNLKISH